MSVLNNGLMHMNMSGGCVEVLKKSFFMYMNCQCQEYGGSISISCFRNVPKFWMILFESFGTKFKLG
jgi:hypothetical protein